MAGDGMRLGGKVALITGGDSRTGRKIASLYAAQGAKVVLCGLNLAKGTETVDRLQAAGAKASFILADVSVADDVRHVIDETVATYGRLDILFNHCDELTTHDTSISQLPEGVWDRILEVNLKGTFLCCQYALPYLVRSGSGSIINLAPCHRVSEMVRSQMAGSVSRGGILAMTREIADEFAARNVRINLIWPNIIGDQAVTNLLPKQSLLANRVFELVSRGASSARAIARTALYLASNDSQDINGAIIVVNTIN
jgi:NAD(P)-dependent dehydrogenase (short-subunit alcohol dehydrogenase family)